MSFRLVKPCVVPPLDEGFRPAVLANRAFQRQVQASGPGAPLVLGLERPDGSVSRFETEILPQAEASLFYAERLLKFLLWQRGASKVYVGGPRSIGDHIKTSYAPGGTRAFDCHFMGNQIYGRPFAVIPCTAEEVPPERESERPLDRHLDGYRIGF
ncbi:MAG: ROK family protein, partial [Anaerolineae bacterium]|nr:ROK family protein [Anaerolineae bacterium]